MQPVREHFATNERAATILATITGWMAEPKASRDMGRYGEIWGGMGSHGLDGGAEAAKPSHALAASALAASALATAFSAAALSAAVTSTTLPALAGGTS